MFVAIGFSRVNEARAEVYRDARKRVRADHLRQLESDARG